MKSKVFFSIIALVASGNSIYGQSIKDADRFARNEQFEDAEIVFNQLIAKKPKDGNNYYYAGINLVNKGDSVAAIEMFDKGILNGPKCKLVLVGKGLMALKQGDQNAAENYFQQALDVKNKLKLITNKEIGRAYLMIEFGSPETLMAYAKKAEEYLNRSNLDFEAKLLLGDALMVINQKDLSQSVQHFIVSGYEAPNDPRPLLKEASVYRRVQNYELAKLRIQEALAKDVEFTPAYRQLADVYGLLNQNDSAIIYYKEYLKRNNNLTARRLYVEALYLNSKFDEAIAEGNELLKQKEIASIYGVIAYAYVGKKECTEDEVKTALNNFDQYEKKFVAPKKRPLLSREMYFKSILLFRDKQYAEAFNLYSTVLKDTSKSSISMYDAVQEQYFNLGTSLQKEMNQLASDTSPAAVNAKLNLEGEMVDAFERSSKIIDLKKMKTGTLNVRDLFYKGRCFNFTNNNSEALKTYQEIVKVDTNYISGYYLIATTSALIDQGDTSGIVTKAYLKWMSKLDESGKLKFARDIENAYRNLAYYAQRNKNYEMASFYYGKVLEMKPDDSSVLDVKKRIDDYLAKLKAREAKKK
jgi:tetratricopeptide (TPR) repeat protein